MAVVLNVASGPSRRTAHNHLLELFSKHGVQAQFFPARSGDALRAAAARAAAEYSTVVAAGGDGTVSTVAAAVAGAKKTLAVLPLGTFNHFARDLGMPVDLSEAVEALRSNRTAMVDLATVNGRAFVNTSSIGLYPRLVLESEHHRRKGFARWYAVATAGIHTLRDFSPVKVRMKTSERQWEGNSPFVFVGNNPYTLEGSRIGSRAELDTGELWVSATFESGFWHLLKLAVQAWLGRVEQNPALVTLSTDELFVESRRRKLYVSLDGEVELLPTPLHYQIHHRALKVLVP
jgi:YegS/Rv2252/BmrU family lipid kinase